MEQNKSNIGLNAGILWHLLSQKGTLSIRQLGEQTNLNSLNIGLAAGWLARENKVVFVYEEDTLYLHIIDCPSEIYY